MTALRHSFEGSALVDSTSGDVKYNNNTVVVLFDNSIGFSKGNCFRMVDTTQCSDASVARSAASICRTARSIRRTFIGFKKNYDVCVFFFFFGVIIFRF